jgi:hypothetical protein
MPKTLSGFSAVPIAEGSNQYTREQQPQSGSALNVEKIEFNRTLQYQMSTLTVLDSSPG